MRWPADVLAHYVLAAGFAHEDAPTVVAMALAATEGDDAYVWRSDVPGGQSFVGPWAIPEMLALEFFDLDAGRLSQAATMLRRLHVAHDGRWDWLPIAQAHTWEDRLDDATAGVLAPRVGIDNDTGLVRTAMDNAAGALSSALVTARRSMLATVEHLRRQV